MQEPTPTKAQAAKAQSKAVAARAKGIASTKPGISAISIFGFALVQQAANKVMPGCGDALGEALHDLLAVMPLL